MELKVFIRNLIRSIINSHQSISTAKAVARYIEPVMKKRIRTSGGVSEHKAPRQNLPKLKESTVKRRRAAKSAGELTGTGAIPELSAINRTGKLIGAITFSPEHAKVDVTIENNQSYKLEELVSENPKWQVMRISDKEDKAIIELLEARLEDAVKKYVKRVINLNKG